MKQFYIFLFLAVLVLFSGCSQSGEEANVEQQKNVSKEIENVRSKGDKKLVLVELFTSEG